jgi:sigma-E factor negative regulatory protein RseA
MKEKLSAFIDDELSELEERQMLEALKRDDELRGTWERYHLFRAAVTRQGIGVSRNFADRVASALESEADTRAPLRFWPLVSGFAVAASIAAVAIVSVQSFGPVPTVVSPTAKSTTSASVVAAATAPSKTASTPASTNPQGRFNAYLVGHNESVSSAGLGGMLPYARVVIYDSDK